MQHAVDISSNDEISSYRELYNNYADPDIFPVMPLHQLWAMQINSTQCMQVLDQACKKAKEIGVDANIAILDTYGHLKLFLRMDNAFLGSIDIAIGKAKTAMLFRMNSESVGEFLQPDKATYGMVNTSGGLVGFKGGMAIQSKGITIAYIGVSGGSPDQDFQIATAGSLI